MEKAKKSHVEFVSLPAQPGPLHVESWKRLLVAFFKATF